MTFIKNLLHKLKELFNMVFKRSVYRRNTCYEPVYASSENKDTNEFVTSYCSEMNSNAYECEVVNDAHTQECTNDVSNDEEHTGDVNDSEYNEDFTDVENKAVDKYGYDIFDKYGMNGRFGTPKPAKFEETREYRIVYADPDSLVKIGLYYRDDNGRLVLTKPMKGARGLSDYTFKMARAKFKCARKFWPKLADFMKENFIEHAYVIFDDTGEPIANVYSDAPELKFTY